MFERLLTIVPAANASRRPRMVIVGAGFGGLAAKIPPASFRHRNLGNLAPIGRKRALADFGRITLSGGAAWWIWGAVHIIFLVGLRNRVSVIIGWLWSYLTYRMGVRLITGEPPIADERDGSRAVAAERAA